MPFDTGRVDAESYFWAWANKPPLYISNYLDRKWLDGLLSGGKKIALIGSGPGRELVWLLRDRHEITCIDVDYEALSRGKNAFPESSIKWINQDFRIYCKTSSEKFDLVISLGFTLAYVPSLSEALAELEAILGRDGDLIFSLPNAEHSREKTIAERRRKRGVHGRHSYSVEAVRNSLAGQGYGLVSIRGQRYIADFVGQKVLGRKNSVRVSRALRILRFLESSCSAVLPPRLARVVWVHAKKMEAHSRP